VESAKSVILDRPLTSFAGALATRSVEILSDPLHFMYTKINKFLNKNPDWNLARLPSYWLSKILIVPPTDDDSHSKEVMWLLENMIEGLRNFAVS
jgi:nucleolar pre-ribosomal-associated protein 1